MRRARRAALLTAFAAACTSPAPPPPSIEAELVQSFVARNGVGLDRLQQTPAQAFCSTPAPRDHARERALQDEARTAVRFPDGDPASWLGDWHRGEALAQSGRGFQYNDPPGAPAGGNCYGCHRLAPAEVAYGTIGPSLTGYGLRRPLDGDAVRATWIRLFDAHALNACSVMPRFGAARILGERDLRDLLALLLDPQSPVNR